MKTEHKKPLNGKDIIEEYTLFLLSNCLELPFVKMGHLNVRVVILFPLQLSLFLQPKLRKYLFTMEIL